jgi:hypothetical protein
MDSPTRRILMQSIMWVILGATVGLAALVSHVRRSALETRLSAPITYRGVSVQLPAKWSISKSQDPQSPVILTATEASGNDDANDDEGGRVVRIVRDPLTTRSAPLEYARGRLNPGDQIPTREADITLAGAPGILLSAPRMHVAKSLQDMIAPRGADSALCAATIPPSGRPLAVELDAPGEVRPEQIDLIQRIAASIKLDDEPPLLDDREVSLGDSIHVALPDDFSMVKPQDPLLTVRLIRPTKDNSEWRSIDIMPIVLLPKDGSATLLTMLSIYDNSSFQNTTAQQDNTGVWKIDADPLLFRYVPTRAYAVAKNGAGVLVIFRGGNDSAWIDSAWQSMQPKITFPDDSKTDDLVAAGTDEVIRLRQAGLSTLLPESNDDLWWLDYIGAPTRPIGWMHLIHGPTNDTIEQRFFIDKQYQELTYSWHGSPDFKTFRSRSEFAITDMRTLVVSQSARQAWGMQTSYAKDRVSIIPGGAGKPIDYAAPPNYIPGGWLPFLLGKLSDRPMILRTDSFVDYAYAQPTDLLTVTIRPQPDAPREGDEGGQPLHCVQVEFSGAGETSRWFFRPDGTLDGVDYSQSQHLIRRDVRDISMDFAHTEPLRPQKGD